MIDLHCHLLPGVDDGPADLAGSLEIARAAADRGIAVIAATPHVRADYPTDVSTMERLLAEVRAAVAAEGLSLDVVGGGELSLEMAASLPPDELRRFGLAGNPRCLLVESPYAGWPLDIGQRLFELRSNGITPVLAHPERNPEVQAQPERLVQLIEAGTLVQVTAASLDGRLGRRAQATGLLLVRKGLAHLLASDAHAASVRRVGMDEACAAIGDPEVAAWLTEGVPSAILRGEPLPARPELRRTGLLARLLRR